MSEKKNDPKWNFLKKMNKIIRFALLSTIMLANFSCITTLSERVYKDDINLNDNKSYIFGKFINNGVLLTALKIENIDNNETIEIGFDNINTKNTKIVVTDPVNKNYLLLKKEILKNYKNFDFNSLKKKNGEVEKLNGLKVFEIKPGKYKFSEIIFATRDGLDYFHNEITMVEKNSFTIEPNKIYYLGEWIGNTVDRSIKYEPQTRDYSYISTWKLEGVYSDFDNDSKELNSFFINFNTIEKVDLSGSYGVKKSRAEFVKNPKYDLIISNNRYGRDLDKIYINNGFVYLYIKWTSIPISKYNLVVKIFNSSQKQVLAYSNDFFPASQYWKIRIPYKFQKETDSQGIWKYEIYLDGNMIEENTFKVYKKILK